VGMASAYMSVRRELHLLIKPEWSYLRIAVPLGLQVSATDILVVANGYVAVAVLRLFRYDFAELGYFTRASHMGILVVTAAVGYKLLYLRWAAPRGEAPKQHVELTLGVAGFVGALGCGVVFVLARYLVIALYGRRFLAAVLPARLMVVGAGVFLIAYVLQVLFTSTGKPQYNIIMLGIGGAVSVVLCLAMVPGFGVVGAAWSCLVSYVAMGAAAIYLGWRHYHLRAAAMLVPSLERLSLFVSALLGWPVRRGGKKARKKPSETIKSKTGCGGRQRWHAEALLLKGRVRVGERRGR